MLLELVTDLRWPRHTGIGQVAAAYISRMPAGIKLFPLQILGRMGDPLAPWKISWALRRKENNHRLFWNPGFVPPLFDCNRSILFVHDLTHLHYYSRVHRIFYNCVFRPLYRRCAAIVCVSEYTRQEFLAWSGMNPEAVVAIPNAVGEQYHPNGPRSNLQYKYILYPGNHRPYKNIIRLVQAYSAAGLSSDNVHLVLTGAPGFALKLLIAQLGLEGFVHFVGYVSEEDLAALYRSAEAIAFVSLYEGFGLPILEAMASGTPVITSSVSAMPEVAGDAALIVDPTNLSEITEALRQVVSNGPLRANLIDRGFVRVKQFSWDRSADQFWRLVQNVHAQRLSAKA